MTPHGVATFELPPFFTEVSSEFVQREGLHWFLQERLCNTFNNDFTMEVFIFGFKNVKRRQNENIGFL